MKQHVNGTKLGTNKRYLEKQTLVYEKLLSLKITLEIEKDY